MRQKSLRSVSLYSLVGLGLVLSGLLAVTGDAPAGADNADARHDGGFNNRDIKGPYGFSFDGFVSARVRGTVIQVPAAAVGQFVSNGRGRATRVVRTLNLGGIAVLTQTGTARYQVNPDGTGRARFRVSTVDCRGCRSLPVEPVLESLEEFSFVINKPRKEIQFIGLAVLDPKTREPAVQISVRGVARKQ